MDNESLLQRIEALEAWKDERERQQINYPLDDESVTILNEYFMRLQELITFIGGVGGQEFPTYLGTQGDINFQVGINDYATYTVDTGSDEVTATRYFEDDMQFQIATTGTPPAPLIVGGTYYVINSNGTTFELSGTPGGSAINLTSEGAGTQYCFSVGF